MFDPRPHEEFVGVGVDQDEAAIEQMRRGGNNIGRGPPVSPLSDLAGMPFPGTAERQRRAGVEHEVEVLGWRGQIEPIVVTPNVEIDASVVAGHQACPAAFRTVPSAQSRCKLMSLPFVEFAALQRLVNADHRGGEFS
ncbi:hypothetical protein BMG05_19805 [Mycobacterium malmoense]|nr:hypothetical protein BMG05_19805 [Mycobacterium malmoense]